MVMNELIAKLEQYDTPTICNAIEVAQGKRGFNQFTRGQVICSAPKNGSMVGFARTAQIAAVEPPSESADVIRARRMNYYRHMATGPEHRVAVIEDVDGDEAIGAYWGEVNTTVHKGLGVCGALTNGLIRDLDDLAEGFTVLAGSVGPSHGFVHIRTIGEPVEVFGLKIADGDLIHADQHGAVVIPPEVIPVICDAIDKLIASEALILGPAREPSFNFEKFEQAWADFERNRT